MAKRQATSESGSKSDAIRKVLSAQPKAKVGEIRAALQEQGVEASDALINKIKYGRNGKSSKGGKRGRPSEGPSKADAIREMLERMGNKARPRDIISALADQGVVVSSAQVSMLRKTTGRGGPGSITLDDLVAAKELAERLGGIGPAREALAQLAQLLEN